jgi:Iap family predicted aminopeptidase
MQNDPNPDVPIILVHPNLASKLFENYQYNDISHIENYRKFELDKTLIEINIDVQIDTITCYNVIAIVPGLDSSLNQEYITVGAHLDHLGKFGNDVFNGANDDASGCVVILEAAKKLAQHPTKRSVMFILYTGEELNSYGSQHFLKHPTIPIDSILFNVNLEQLGSMNRTVKGLWLIGDSLFSPYFYSSVDSICRKKLIFDNIEEYRKALRSTDCRSYFDVDIPTMMLSSGGYEEYHTRYDDIELIDFEHMRFATEFLYSFISKMANDSLLFEKSTIVDRFE